MPAQHSRDKQPENHTSAEPKLKTMGVRTDTPISTRSRQVCLGLMALAIVGSGALGIKALNLGIEKIDAIIQKSQQATPQQHKVTTPDAPRHNYKEEFKSINLVTTNERGEKIDFCALQYQGKNLELITGVHFMELSNEARKYGIDLKISRVEGMFANNIQIETTEAISWMKHFGLLFGFTPAKEPQTGLVREGVFEFNRNRATEEYLALPENLKAQYAEGSTFGFIQSLKLPGNQIVIPVANKEVQEYFQTAGLAHGFVPTEFRANKPQESYAYVHNPEKAHELLSALSNQQVNSYQLRTIQGSIWKTVSNEFPYLAKNQLSKIVDLTITLNKSLDETFDPSRLRSDAIIIMPHLQEPTEQEFLDVASGSASSVGKNAKKITANNEKKKTDAKPAESNPMAVENLAKLAVSNDGLDLIKAFEQFRANRYPCQGGKLTIGYGCIIPSIVNGPPLTEPQAVKILDMELTSHLNRVKKLVAPQTIKQLNSNQIATLVSFDFNTGALDSSTLLTKLNEGNLHIAEYLCLYNKVRENGSGPLVFSDGLLRRRLSEMLLYYGASGKESYISADSYNKWSKDLKHTPGDTFQNKDLEKEFIAQMILKAQNERLKSIPAFAKN